MATPRTNGKRPAPSRKDRRGSTHRPAKQNDSKGITEADILAGSKPNGEMHVVMMDPRKLVPYEKNAMIHREDQVKQIADSITEFGFTNPVLIDENKEILAGHGRREAALQLKLLRVPVIVLGHLSDVQKMAYRLADNKLARNSDFEWQLVADELKELQARGYDLGLTGFRDFEIEPMLAADWKPPEAEDGEGVSALTSIPVTVEQKKIIEQAHARMKAAEEDDEMSIGRCLELVCADYLAG